MRTYRTVLTEFIVLWQALYLRIIWKGLPARIPNHFIHGVPERVIPKQFVLVFVILSAVFAIALRWLQNKPQLFNLPAASGDPARVHQEAIAREFLGWIALEIVTLFAIMTYTNTQPHSAGSIWLFDGMIAVIVLTAIFFLIRLRSTSRNR
jgi:hypothetical protein